MKKLAKKIYKFIVEMVKTKKKNSILYASEYLEKFEYGLSEEWKQTENISDYIWQFWNQGEENAPLIVKRCLESVKKFHPEKKIIVIDDNSIDKYIEIPSFIKEKFENGIISRAHYSDYIRTCLLVKYGGVWIDATVLLTGKIPDVILNQNFFVFKNPLWYDYKTVPSKNLFELFLSSDNNSGLFGSNWFIVAKPNNPILINQKNLLEQYWSRENITIHYFLYHLFISKSVIKNQKCREVFEAMYSLSNKEPHLLQNVMNEKFDANMFEEIKKLSKINKLTYKYDKIAKKSFLEHILTEND